MRQDEPIEIFGLLRRHRPTTRRGRGRERMTVEFRAPEVYFNASNVSVAREFAATLTAFAKRMLQSGRDLAGKAMPPSAPATLERRSYRQKQAARGGAVDDRYKDEKFKSRALKNFGRRFKASKLGTFTPRAGESHLGVESGMLAASPAVAPQADGSFRMFFSVARAQVDRYGTSAVGRVFGPGKAATWSNESMRDPEIQTGLRDLARSLFQSRAQRLASELRDLGSNVADIVNATQEAAEVDADAG